MSCLSVKVKSEETNDEYIPPLQRFNQKDLFIKLQEEKPTFEDSQDIFQSQGIDLSKSKDVCGNCSQGNCESSFNVSQSSDSSLSTQAPTSTN